MTGRAEAVVTRCRAVVTDPVLGGRLLAGRWWDWVVATHLRQEGRRDRPPVPQFHDKVRDTVRRNALLSLAGLSVTGTVVAGDLLVVPESNPVPWSLAGVAVAGCWLRGWVTRRRETRLERAAHGEFRAPSSSGVPDEQALTTVFQTAGVLRAPTVTTGGAVSRPGQALRLVEKTFTGDRWQAIVEFPAGMSAAQVVKKHAEIASALGASVSTVVLDLVPGHAARLQVTVFAADPFDGPPVVSPLADAVAGVVSPYEPQRLGLTPTGEPVTLSLFQGNLLVASMPGYGKTSVVRVVLAPVVLDPCARLVVFDGKPDNADNSAYAQVAEVFRQGDHDTVAVELLYLLRELFHEGQARFARLRRLGADKLTRDIHENTTHPDLALTCVFIDEVHLFTANRAPGPWPGSEGKPATVGQLITEELVRIIKTPGRAGGIPLVLATQDVHESTGGLPRAITKVINNRIGLYLDGPAESNSVLGQGKASQGWDCSADAMMRQGVGILRRGMPQPGQPPLLSAKFDYLTPEQADQLAARGRTARHQHGLLRGDAVAWTDQATAHPGQVEHGPRPRRCAIDTAGESEVVSPVLAAVARYLDGDLRELVPTSELYDALPSALRADLTLTAFGRLLTAWNIPKILAPGRGGAPSRRVIDIHTATTHHRGRQLSDQPSNQLSDVVGLSDRCRTVGRTVQPGSDQREQAGRTVTAAYGTVPVSGVTPGRAHRGGPGAGWARYSTIYPGAGCPADREQV